MGKIGIFAPYNFGDVIMSTPILRHRQVLWPGKEIVWFITPKVADLFVHNHDVSSLRTYDDAHLRRRNGKTGLLHGVGGPDTNDLDLAFFPVAWQNMDLLNRTYSDIPKIIYGVNFPEWSPCLYFSAEEDQKAELFVKSMPYPRTVMLETVSFSGQSRWSQETTLDVMNICQRVTGGCNFILASKDSFMPSRPYARDCSGFTIRQCIPIYNRSHLFIGCASGISWATTSWSANSNVPRVEYCASNGLSTRGTARGRHETCLDVQSLYSAVEREARVLGRGI